MGNPKEEIVFSDFLKNPNDNLSSSEVHLYDLGLDLNEAELSFLSQDTGPEDFLMAFSSQETLTPEQLIHQEMKLIPLKAMGASPSLQNYEALGKKGGETTPGLSKLAEVPEDTFSPHLDKNILFDDQQGFDNVEFSSGPLEEQGRDQLFLDTSSINTMISASVHDTSGVFI